MTATKPAPARTLTFDTMTRMLRLAVGRSVEAYSLQLLPAEGVTQVALYKFAAADETRYVVTIAGEASRCTCPAGSYGKSCKHEASVRALQSRGLLTAAE